MKVLIVDDESYIREGLVSLIRWQEYGIDEIMQAKDGREAVQISQWFHPDIVLTDIEMPRMSGIQFADQLADVCPESALIFITAYMDTSYLKQAIRLSAVDFIEKPISAEAVANAVEKAARSVREKQASICQGKQLKANQFVNMLRYRSQNQDQLLHMCREIGFPDHGWYYPAVLSKKGVSPAQDMGSFLSAFQGMGAVGTDIEDNKYLAVIPHKEQDCKKVLWLAKDYAREHPEYCVGMGFEVDNLQALSESIRIALYNTDRGFFSEENYFELNESVKLNRTLQPGLYMEFSTILAEKPEEIRNWLGEVFRFFEGPSGYGRKDVQNFVVALFRMMAETHQWLMLILPELTEGKELEQYVAELPSARALQQFMEQVCDRYLEEESETKNYSKLVRDVIHYIEKNCSEPQLDVASIAEAFHFSNAHLNVLFKQDTGVTLKKYIINYRLELAKKMLRNKYCKINEIAEACGYSDANYFSKAFKAGTGMIPIEYRKKYFHNSIE